MNWSSVKNLLIAILIGANLFLVYNIVRQYQTRTYLTEEELDGAIALLADRGIAVDPDGVPLEKFDGYVYECGFNDEYYTEIAQRMADSPRDMLLSLPDGGLSITAENGDVVEFDSEFGFSYVGNDIFKTVAYTDVTADNIGILASELDELKGSSYSALSKKTIAFLTSEGDSGLRPETEIMGGFVDDTTGIRYLLAVQKIDETDIYSHYAVCVFDGEELIGAYGRWFFAGFDKVHSAEFTDQISVLFSDLSYLKSNRAVIGLNDGVLTSDTHEATLPSVTRVAVGYVTYWNPEKTALYFIPAWLVAHSDGQTVVYNAANGEVYSRKQ